MKNIFIIGSFLAVLLFMAVPFVGAANGMTGKVLETMDSGGYTYTLIENNGQKTWVAVPQTKIKVGETVTFKPGMPMTNFKSKSLNREFKIIYFSEGLEK